MTDWIGWGILSPLLVTIFLILAKFSAYLAEDKAERSLKFSTSSTLALLTLYLLFLTTQHIFQDTASSISLGQWLKSGDFVITISFLFDFNNLVSTVLFAIILTTLFWFIPLKQKQYSQQYLLYSLFSSAFFLFLLADQWYLTLIAWEITAITVYLLLFYRHADQVLVFKQTSVFYLGRLSSLFLFIALLLASSWLEIDHWHDLADTANQLESLQAIVLMSFFILSIIVRLLSFSCILRHLAFIEDKPESKRASTTKSALIMPLAMMIFTLLTALYLLIKLEPLFQQTALLQGLFAIVSLIFALAATVQALASSDPSRRLILHSLAHSGWIFLLCSLGLSLLALAYLLMYSLAVSWQILQLRPYQTATAPHWLQKNKSLYAIVLRGFLPARFPHCD